MGAPQTDSEPIEGAGRPDINAVATVSDVNAGDPRQKMGETRISCEPCAARFHGM